MLFRVHVVTVTKENGAIDQQAVFYSEAEAYGAYKRAKQVHGDERALLNHHTPIRFTSARLIVREWIRRAAIFQKAMQRIGKTS
jgi:hypothetical protein